MLSRVWYYTQRPLIAAVVIFALLLGGKCAIAVADLDAEGRELFWVLHEQQGFPMPISYPVYHAGMDGDTPRPCAHAGGCYYRGHIWIGAALLLSERERKAALLHENVHHLQFEAHGEAKNCQQGLDNERAAYKAQQIYVMENFHIRVENRATPYCVPGAA